MKVNIVPDIHTVEQATDAITDLVCRTKYTATVCDELANLYRTRARLAREVGVNNGSAVVQEIAAIASAADLSTALRWAKLAADGRK